MNALIRFVARLRPADLILPAGAALVSAGLQQLVDREDRARRRLAALQELAHLHRDRFAEAGLPLPSELLDDEGHPLDTEAALQVALCRTPTDDQDRVTVSRPERPVRMMIALLGVATGVAGGMLLQRRTGFLGAIAAALPTSPAELSHVPPATAPNGQPCVCVQCEEARASSNSYPDSGEQVGGVIGRGEPPAEECGWPGCDWTSDATRPVEAQRTAAALHRNACTFRPAGAVVRE